MKRNIIYLLLFSSALIFSQERTNREEISFFKESEIIENALGWAYNEQLGEWIDNKNCIYKSDKKRFNKSLAKQNFINLQFKSVKYNSKIYYILIIPSLKYSYKYIYSEVGFYNYKEIDLYIFSEEEYSKISSIKNEIKLGTRIHRTVDYKNRRKTNKLSLDIIQSAIESALIQNLNQSDFDKKYLNDFTYIFPIKSVNLDGNYSIRFLLPVWYSKLKDEDSYSYDFNFEKEYFELEKKEFEKLLIKD
jgi:hypothetical protein